MLISVCIDICRGGYLHGGRVRWVQGTPDGAAASPGKADVAPESACRRQNRLPRDGGG
jgi:hypothetical protein